MYTMMSSTMKLTFLETLLSTLAEFCNRVSSTFSAVSAQKEEIAALRKDLRAADAAKNRMHQEKDQAQRLASQAVDTADQARREVVILRGEKDALKKRIDVQARDFGEQLAEKTRDRTNLCDMIVAHKEKVRPLLVLRELL